MNTLELNIPEQIQVSSFELSMILASQLYDKGFISSGQGAEMVGISKRAFIELLGKYGVSVFGYTFEELEEELKNV